MPAPTAMLQGGKVSPPAGAVWVGVEDAIMTVGVVAGEGVATWGADVGASGNAVRFVGCGVGSDGNTVGVGDGSDRVAVGAGSVGVSADSGTEITNSCPTQSTLASVNPFN